MEKLYPTKFTTMVRVTFCDTNKSNIYKTSKRAEQLLNLPIGTIYRYIDSLKFDGYYKKKNLQFEYIKYSEADELGILDGYKGFGKKNNYCFDWFEEDK